MTLETHPFDPAEYLNDPDAISAYMNEAFDTGDAGFIGDALGTVARARGMTEIAREAGLSRESLYRALSAAGNPEFSTVLRVVRGLGLRLSAGPAEVSHS